MADSNEDFAVLLERARRGDQEALTQLAQQYEFKVRLVARYLLGPALRPYLDSVDLVQSVHRSLLVGLRQDKFDLSSPENLMALALTMVRRKAARQWRRLQRQKRLEAAPSGEPSGLSQLLTSLSSPQPDPARAAQFDDQVRHLCNGLDAADRRLLELRLQGHSPAEIAGQLGLSVNALYVRLTRLRQRLRASGVLEDCL
jgi:RNA polymerase sigma-70 factor (ECF subfamily)